MGEAETVGRESGRPRRGEGEKRGKRFRHFFSEAVHQGQFSHGKHIAIAVAIVFQGCDLVRCQDFSEHPPGSAVQADRPGGDRLKSLQGRLVKLFSVRRARQEKDGTEHTLVRDEGREQEPDKQRLQHHSGAR